MLAAREERWNRRLLLARKYSCVVVTVTICLPAAFRTDCRLSSLFDEMFERLFAFLEQEGMKIRCKETDNIAADGPAAYLAVSGSAEQVKRLCVKAEEELVFGRLTDIDVMDEHGGPVGREEIGAPPRTCFICREPAAVCVAGRRHCASEISQYIKGQIRRVQAAWRQQEKTKESQ